jgi:hypothetical protein
MRSEVSILKSTGRPHGFDNTVSNPKSERRWRLKAGCILFSLMMGVFDCRWPLFGHNSKALCLVPNALSPGSREYDSYFGTRSTPRLLKTSNQTSKGYTGFEPALLETTPCRPSPSAIASFQAAYMCRLTYHVPCIN